MPWPSDEHSPATAIELGQYLDNVEDDPAAAVKAYAQGIESARRQLIEGLIGQAKAYRQLEQWEAFYRCVEEVLPLTRFSSKTNGAQPLGGEILIRLSPGSVDAINLQGPYAEQIRELLCELGAERQ